jgi:hypothetical protein
MEAANLVPTRGRPSIYKEKVNDLLSKKINFIAIANHDRDRANTIAAILRRYFRKNSINAFPQTRLINGDICITIEGDY